MAKADIGLWGLAVMGQNLVLNMESKGFTAAVYNRTTEKVKDFVRVVHDALYASKICAYARSFALIAEIRLGVRLRSKDL